MIGYHACWYLNSTTILYILLLLLSTEFTYPTGKVPIPKDKKKSPTHKNPKHRISNHVPNRPFTPLKKYPKKKQQKNHNWYCGEEEKVDNFSKLFRIFFFVPFIFNLNAIAPTHSYPIYPMWQRYFISQYLFKVFPTFHFNISISWKQHVYKDIFSSSTSLSLPASFSCLFHFPLSNTVKSIVEKMCQWWRDEKIFFFLCA